RLVLASVGILELAVGVTTMALAANAKTALVRVNSSGEPANADSGNPSLSADGRFVAFASFATNLDPSGVSGIFVRDRKTGKTQQVNVSAAGKTGNGYCHHPSISADGRYVAYESKATNLVKGARGYNIYVRDRKRHRTILASLSSSGRRANAGSHKASISG